MCTKVSGINFGLLLTILPCFLMSFARNLFDMLWTDTSFQGTGNWKWCRFSIWPLCGVPGPLQGTLQNIAAMQQCKKTALNCPSFTCLHYTFLPVQCILQLLLFVFVKMCPIVIQTLFLNSSYIFSFTYSSLNVPDETTVKVTFMNGKLEKCVVLPKGLYMVLFKRCQLKYQIIKLWVI